MAKIQRSNKKKKRIEKKRIDKIGLLSIHAYAHAKRHALARLERAMDLRFATVLDPGDDGGGDGGGDDGGTESGTDGGTDGGTESGTDGGTGDPIDNFGNWFLCYIGKIRQCKTLACIDAAATECDGSS
jgi:hypothetical protein